MAENGRERVEALLNEATVESATALAELERQAGDKESRKAARRALYLLSMRGIRPTPEILTGEALPGDPMPETLRAYASGFDGAGNRILFFEIAGPDGGKPTAVQMLFNDQTGLQTCDSARLDRRELRRRIQQLEQLPAEGLAFVEITPDYGRWLLEEARELLRRQNKPSPTGVLELLPRIGVPRHDYLVSPVYDSISVETLNADETIERDPRALFELTWFENWFFAVEDVLRALSDWENATDTSDTSPDEKAAARELIVREVTTDLFTPGVRARYVRRLEDTADILWRLSHTNEAKMALIHAQTLAGGAPVAEVPFARALVERTLIAGLAVMKEKRAERARQG
ncbi:MAG: hypothetical protein JWL77_5436 [Chthonomonadaceae bacterium]|nr:hypothetical protein [Chthonomonadaceae bacterium]